MTTKNRRWRLAQALEIRWWQWYLRDQPPGAYLNQKRAYWHRLLADLDLHIAAGSQVLDAGCGPAGIFMALPDTRMTAVDPLLHRYAERLPHFQPTDYPYVEFHNQPLETWSASGRYDYVFCLNAINHVADWAQALQRVLAATKRTGTVVLSSDVHRHQLLKRIFRAMPGDALHPQQHDRDDYRMAFRQTGWRIVREHTAKQGRIFDYWVVVLRWGEREEGY